MYHKICYVKIWGQIIGPTLFGPTLQQTDLSTDRMVLVRYRFFNGIRSDGIIENFLPRQGTESARCTIFRSDAVVFFGWIPLVGRSVEGSVRWVSVRCPASKIKASVKLAINKLKRLNVLTYIQNKLIMPNKIWVGICVLRIQNKPMMTNHQNMRIQNKLFITNYQHMRIQNNPMRTNHPNMRIQNKPFMTNPQNMR